MANENAERVQSETVNPLDARIERVKELFPEAVNEDGIDFEILANLLGKRKARMERYSLTWAGKQDAILSLHNRSHGSLKPVQEESVNWDDTKNVFIEGDNLEVLKLLYKSYFGRVKMIYIDPPYNTGNDFVYPDDYSDPVNHYLRLTGQVDDAGNLQTSEPDKAGRKHSSWLSMMYPRLFLARQLLRDDGVIFVSIDDNEANNLRTLMNEIFGEENFIDCVIWKKRYGGGAKEKHLVSLHEYVLFYAKTIDNVSPIFIPTSEKKIRRYYKLKDAKYEIRGPYRTHPLEATKSMGPRPNLVFPISAPDGTQVMPRRQWLWSKERVQQALKRGEIEFISSKNEWSVHTKQYLRDETGTVRESKEFSIIDDVYTQHGTNEIIDIFGDAQVFPFPKPVSFVKRLLNIGTDNASDDIVLDFFAGSASTADALLALNREDNGKRRFVMVQMYERMVHNEFKNVADVSKERIRRVIDRMESEKQGRLDGLETHPSEDLGFRLFQLTQPPTRQWPDMSTDDTSAEEYATQLELSLSDPLLDGWTIPDVIADVALKEAGFTLSYRVEQIATDLGEDGPTICKVQDDDKEQNFYICLDVEISFEAVKQLDLSRDDLFVLRDNAADDTTIANLALTCHIKTI